MRKLIPINDCFSGFARTFSVALLMLLTMLLGIRPSIGQSANGLHATSSTLTGSKVPQNKNNWTLNPFEQKVFIENKGQFDSKNGNDGRAISYGISNDGVEVYFTSGGLTYKHDEYKELDEDEIMAAAKADDEEKGEEDRNHMTKTISHFAHMNWEGASSDVKIIAGDRVSYYFTYPDMNDKSGASSIQASAVKKITYQNIYPGIDVEYTFPENKKGIKYNLILHPGADLSVVKMHYSSISGIRKDGDGNILLETPFGDIIDHAPVSYYQDGTPVASAFEVSGNTVSFKLSNTQSAKSDQSIIIDPWTTNPAFSGYNAAYDVEYDLAGNVYVYGGGYPWKEIKFNSAGVIQWIYTASLLYASGCTSGPCYGDFAVAGAGGSSYIVEAFNGGGGTRVIKLNSGGFQKGLYAGSAQLAEMWRISYNNCTKQAIIAGGGTSQTYQACLLDTNVTNMTPVNVLSATAPFHDFALLSIDNYGNCFMASAQKATNPGVLDNVLVKCPANSLLPVAYMVPDGHAFKEVGSINYVNNITSQANGFNGMAVGSQYLYTYNGSVLKKWNKNTGALINSVTLSATPFSWGGLEVNDCGNIFAGVQSSVLELDTNLIVVNTIPVTNEVYDLKLAPSGDALYVSGLGFVSSIAINPANCGSLNLSVSSTPDSCSAAGSATVVPIGGVGPFSYLWSPTGQTTQTATGLSAGTYTVTVNDLAFSPCSNSGGGSQTTTVTVSGGGSTVADAFPDTTVCPGSLVQLHASPSGGSSYQWSPANGLSDPNIADPFAFPLTTTTYTVTVTAGGCSSTATVTISSFTPLPVPLITQRGDSLICSTDPLYSTYQWYFDNQPVPGATDTIFFATQSGNFNVAVTDVNGCSISVGINIVLGLKGISSAQAVYLFPNPASELLTVFSPAIKSNKQITILIENVLGETVIANAIKFDGQAAVNIKDLSSGVYFLQLINGNEKWVGRFVKK